MAHTANPPLRLIFMGTPEFAVPTFKACLASGHEVVAAYTRAAKPAGRGMALRPSPVEVAAHAAGVPVFTPKTLRTPETQAEFAALNADVAIVIAYGLILPPAILTAPRLGCFNLHGSLLPRWRGAAPMQRAIMAGDSETGIMLMQMEEGLDTGPVGLTKRCAILPEDNGGTLHDKMALLAAEVLREGLVKLTEGTLQFMPQTEIDSSYAAKITAEDQRLDFTKRAEELHNHVRALTPFPGAYFGLKGAGAEERGEERVKVLESAVVFDNAATETAPPHNLPGTLLDKHMTLACGGGTALRLLKLQRAGKAPMKGADFFNGARVRVGDVVG